MTHAWKSLAPIAAALGLLALSHNALAAGRTLPVPNTTIYPGTVIAAEMLTARTFTPAAEPKFPVLATPSELTGMMALRTLLPGQPVTPAAVRPPYTVMPGKPVPVVFVSGGLTITGSAIALQAGSAGETISARNMDSGLVIKATIQSDGTLRVDEP